MKVNVFPVIAATLVVGSQAQDLDELADALACVGGILEKADQIPECYVEINADQTFDEYSCGGNATNNWDATLSTIAQETISCYSKINNIVSECKEFDGASILPDTFCPVTLECVEECKTAAQEIIEKSSGATQAGFSTLATAAVLAAMATQLF